MGCKGCAICHYDDRSDALNNHHRFKKEFLIKRYKYI